MSLIASILPKWAKNINETFGAIAEKLAKAGAAAAKRFKVLNTINDIGEGYFALNLGISLGRNGAFNAAWRYEVYLSFFTHTLRIGFVPYKPKAIIDKLFGQKVTFQGGEVVASGGTTEFQHVDEYHPDEANERP